MWTKRFYPDIGGLEIALKRLLDLLTKNGFMVDVVTTTKSFANSPRLQVHTFDEEHFWKDSTEFILNNHSKWDALYVARISQDKPEQHLAYLGRIENFDYSFLRVPTTFHLKKIRKIDRKNVISRIFSHLIALNRKSAIVCKALYPEVTVIQSSNLVELPDNFSINYKSYYLFSGRITPSKNLVNLLGGWAMFKSEIPNERTLRIYGTPYHPAYFQECLDRIMETEDVSYYGTYPAGTFDVIDKAFFVVIPSFREGHSNLMNEALSCATPIIASDIPGLRDHLTHERSLLIPKPLKARNIAQRLKDSLLISQEDYRSMALNCRNYAKNNLIESNELELLLSLKRHPGRDL